MRILTIILLIIFKQGISQSIPRTVLDANTKSPIPFVTIKVINTTKGDIANSKGEFQLDIEISDSVVFSSIGYKTQTIIGKEINQIIYLEPIVHELLPITIKRTLPPGKIIVGNGKDLVEQKISCKYNKGPLYDDCVFWGPSNTKEEFAEKILLDSTKLYKLIKLYIPTRKKSLNVFGPILLRVYSQDSISGMPGEELFLKYFDVSKKNIYKNKVEINLSKDNFYINGLKCIYVSIGWPPTESTKTISTHIQLVKLNHTNTFSRSLTNKTFDWFPFGKIGNLTIDEKWFNTIYALVLEEHRYK